MSSLGAKLRDLPQGSARLLQPRLGLLLFKRALTLFECGLRIPQPLRPAFALGGLCDCHGQVRAAQAEASPGVLDGEGPAGVDPQGLRLRLPPSQICQL